MVPALLPTEGKPAHTMERTAVFYEKLHDSASWQRTTQFKLSSGTQEVFLSLLGYNYGSTGKLKKIKEIKKKKVVFWPCFPNQQVILSFLKNDFSVVIEGNKQNSKTSRDDLGDPTQQFLFIFNSFIYSNRPKLILINYI